MFNNKEDKKVEAEITSSSNTIAKGTILYGDIETHGNLRVEGKVEGNIKTKSKIVLGKSSEVIGNIKAQNAEVEGIVSGRLDVSDMLVLKTSSTIEGDITANKLIVEAGAKFNGGCKMGNVHALPKNEPLKSEKSTPVKEPQQAGTL